MSSDEESSKDDEWEFLEFENQLLKAEQTRLLDSILALSRNLKELSSEVDSSLILENEELSEELKVYRNLVGTLKNLSPGILEDDEWGKVSGDIPGATEEEEVQGSFKPSKALLKELTEEADMKVLSLLAASQCLQGGNWIKAKYPVGAPIFFQDLKFHYQLGKNWLGQDIIDQNDRSLNMRFDMVFPGFPASVASEIAWRLFCSEEQQRIITRCDSLTCTRVYESCDPKTGDRVQLQFMENPLKETNKIQTIPLSCRRTRRLVARSTLSIPRLSRSKRKDKLSKRARSDENVGNVDAYVISQSSTKLFPIPKRHNTELIQGQVIRGSFTWQEPEGARIVCVIS